MKTSLLPARVDVVVALITLLVAPLFLFGLGDTYLWQDEAQTALLGRSVLKHGVPMVGTGSESLSAVMGEDAGIGGMYFQVSWLQAYVTAASFRVFGESNWAARVPFAVIGWLCVPLVAWAMRQAGANRSAARIAAVLTALNVPFIVCSRQARYYALGAAMVLLVMGTYARLACTAGVPDVSRRDLSAFAFCLAASLLVLTFDVTAIGVLGVLALHWVMTQRDGGHRWSVRFWTAWGLAFLLLFGWEILSFTAPSRRSHAGFIALFKRFQYGIPYYIGQINAHLMPLPLLLLVVLNRRNHDRFAAGLFATVVAGGLAGAMLSPFRFFRYAVPVLPVVLALAATGLDALSRRGRHGRIATAVLVLALVMSTAPYVLSHSLFSRMARSTGLVKVRGRVFEYRVPLAELVQELRDPPKGPVAAAVEYLRIHARPGDIVVATYGELPLRFHTGLTVYGGETAQLPPAGVAADWLWPRRLGLYREVRASEAWIKTAIASRDYERIELPAVDRRWENREDPEEHVFSNPGPPGPSAVLYRLRRGVE